MSDDPNSDDTVQVELDPLVLRASEMMSQGYTVLPVAIFTHNLQTFQANFQDTCRTFPEFQYGYFDKRGRMAMGGFGALNHASAYHNPFVRNVRKHAMRACVPFFSFLVQLMERNDLRLEQPIDRTMLRRKGDTPSRETWHRDESSLTDPNRGDDDVLFGGWVNFDDKPQLFSCVPRTHLVVPGARGFFKLPKDQHNKYQKRSVKVNVPPGHLLVFYENIIHEVLAKRAKHDQYRVFLAWRLTTSNTPLVKNIKDVLKRQEVVRIKSGQWPRMYPQLYWTNWRDKISQFTNQALKPELRSTRVVVSGRAQGETVTVPVWMQRYNLGASDAVMPGLKPLAYLGVQPYPEYTKEEIAMHEPNTRWNIGGDMFELYPSYENDDDSASGWGESKAAVFE